MKIKLLQADFYNFKLSNPQTQSGDLNQALCLESCDIERSGTFFAWSAFYFFFPFNYILMVKNISQNSDFVFVSWKLELVSKPSSTRNIGSLVLLVAKLLLLVLNSYLKYFKNTRRHGEFEARRFCEQNMRLQKFCWLTFSHAMHYITQHHDTVTFESCRILCHSIIRCWAVFWHLIF